MTTDQLDAIAEEMIRAAGGNAVVHRRSRAAGAVSPHAVHLDRHEVVHGMPCNRRIREGRDRLRSTPVQSSMAGTATRRERSIVGDVPEPVRELVEATRQAMYAGIAAAVPGNYLSDISAAVEDVARASGYGIVRAFVGHGIGNEMHEEPQVPNYRTGSRGRRLEPGLCLAIEPMFTLGVARGARCATTAGRSRLSTARWPRTGNTRSPVTPTGRES